jgi:hypothetical protein
MFPGPPKRFPVKTLLFWAAPLLVLGCGGNSGTDIALPPLTIATATTGVELDADGYSVAVDANPARPIGQNASLTVDGLSAGPHTVGLTGLAPNCLASDNPRTVTISSGATPTAAFAVTCGPTTGTIVATTSTTGDGSDPDGFTITVDGAERGVIGLNASVNIAGLVPGSHLLALTGMAANCQLTGDNPRSVTVSAGQNVTVALAVACAAPAPNAGTLQVATSTNGSNPDPDGYSISLDGRTAQPVGTNATFVVPNVAAGQHAIQLLGVASNCTVAGLNPRSIAVRAGQSTAVAFSVTCAPPPPETGSIQVTAVTTGGSVDPDGYRISADGGNVQDLGINGSRTITGLAPGTHTVELTGKASNCTVAGDNPRSVTVLAGQAVTVSFAITCAASVSPLNFRISNVYITQSTQTLAGTVPLVAGRSAYLRVFVVANQTAGSKPDVEVTFRNGATTTRRTISAPAGALPTTVQEGVLGSSWNLTVDPSLIQPGLSISAEVDARKAIPETNENDNTFPASGIPQALTVTAVPPARIRFIPIRQGGAPPGNVSASNKDQLVELARKLFPLNAISTDVHAVYPIVDGTLQADGSGWNQVLSDIEGMRVAEGSDQTYFGIARLDYQFGIVGLGFVGLPSAMGTDSPGDIRRVIAHELGHTWNQLHAPCGNPPNQDSNYPYGVGIGVYGFDVAATSLKPPSTSDIMGYCADPWISDYTYRRVLTYRGSAPASSQMAASAKQPTIMVWGRIENGQAMLEPTFQIMTRPVLPAQPGPYSVEGIASDGSSLFRLSFDPTKVADDPRGSRHFAFAVPLDQTLAARLQDVRLSGPGGVMSAASLSLARIAPAGSPDSIVVRREAGEVAVEWNSSIHPMVMVRDPDTGEVLSFGRGGKVRVTTAKGTLELVQSDGVRSRARRIAVHR